MSGCGRAEASLDAALETETIEVETIEVETIEVETREDVAIETREDVAPEAQMPPDLTACEVTGSDRVPLPEASGAALVDAEGARILLVADSGNAGRALVIDRVHGQSIATTLPLGDGAGDDIEGLDRAPDGRIFGLASNGQLRAWRPTEGDPNAFELVLGPVPVSTDPAFACDPFGVNCAANFEGLCLHPAPAPDACAGWAASKALGELICLRADGAGYRIDGAERIAVTEPERVSACTFEPEPPHRLLVGGNLFAASAIWLVDGGPPRELVERGAGNQEALLMMPGGHLESYGDAQDFLEDLSPRTTLECR